MEGTACIQPLHHSGAGYTDEEDEVGESIDSVRMDIDEEVERREDRSMNYNEDIDAEGNEGTGEDWSSGDSDAAYSDKFKLNTDEEDDSEDKEEEGRDEVNQLDETFQSRGGRLSRENK